MSLSVALPPVGKKLQRFSWRRNSYFHLQAAWPGLFVQPIMAACRRTIAFAAVNGLATNAASIRAASRGY